MSAKSNAGRVGVWGRSGAGKSAYCKKRIKGRKRVLVFDPLAEYGRDANCKAIHHARRDGLDQVRLAMAANWPGFRLAYVPPSGQEAKALSALCRLLMAAQRPYQETGKGDPLTLVVEEMNLSFPVSGGAVKCPGFAEICSRGRHYGIEVIGLSQRIAEVDTRFRGNCTETVVFAQKGPRDIQAAADALGANRPQVQALGNLEYLHEAAGQISSGKLSFGKRAANTNAAPKPAKKRA